MFLLCYVLRLSGVGSSRGESRSVPRPADRHRLSSVSWVIPGASYRMDMPWRNHQGGILSRCPSHLILALLRGAATLPWAPSEQQSFSPLSNGEPSHPTEEAHFRHSYPSKLVTIGKSRNKNQLLNQEACLWVQLFLNNKTVQTLHQSTCRDPSAGQTPMHPCGPYWG